MPETKLKRLFYLPCTLSFPFPEVQCGLTTCHRNADADSVDADADSVEIFIYTCKLSAAIISFHSHTQFKGPTSQNNLN